MVYIFALVLDPYHVFLILRFPSDVLFFYPLDFTFVCPTEITAFSDRANDFAALNGCKVIAASIDSKFSHLAWIQTPRNKGGLGKMAIPVLSDLNKTIAKSLGFLIDGEEDGDAGVALRGTVIVDGHGVIRHISANDLPVGRSVDEVLRLVEAFQYVDVHGEVCPTGWKKGAKTMIADSVKSQEYFSTLQ